MTPEIQDHGHPVRRRWRWGRAAFLAPLVIVLCLVATACGGAATQGAKVASVGKSTATTDPSAGGGSGNSGSGSNSNNYEAALKYSECMRSHGVPNFPDPSSDGAIEIQGGANSSNGLNPNSAQFKSADQACRHLLPNGGHPSAAQQQQFLSQALKFSECMRRHGITNFPDPTTSGGGVSLKINASSGIDPRSPKFQAAQKACSSFLPGRAQSGSPSGSGSGSKSAIAG